MKKAIAILLLLSMLLSLCACAPAPAEKPEEQPGKSPDTAEPESPDPEPTKPDQTNGKEGAETGDNDIKGEKTVYDLYDEFLAAPVEVPADFTFEYPSLPESAPEAEDGLYFSCRNMNLLIGSTQVVYTFYVFSETPIDENKFDFNSGLRAQAGYTFEEVMLQGYKENNSTLSAFSIYDYMAQAEDWRPYAWLLDKYVNSAKDAETYVYYNKYRTFVYQSEREAAQKANAWSKEMPKFHAYQVDVTFIGTAISEMTDVVSVTVKGKRYNVNCGCIRVDGKAPILSSKGLAYGGGVMVGGAAPYANGVVCDVPGSLIEFQALDSITVTDVAIEDASGKLRVEGLRVQLNHSDGTSEDFVPEEGGAFSMGKRDRLIIFAKLYDSDAVELVYSANFLVRIAYKTTEGKTEYAGRYLIFNQRTPLYQLFFTVVKGVDYGPLYEYVLHPVHTNKNYIEEHYKPVPTVGNDKEKYLFLREFFGVA